MPWKEPKTDWIAEDWFNAEPDWNRITGNIQYLQALARPFFGDIKRQEIPEVTIVSLPFADTLNAAEDNWEALLTDTYNLPEFPRKEVQYPNSPVWDYRDLNRIERMLLRLYELIPKAEPNRPTLAFTLGGGEFASAL